MKFLAALFFSAVLVSCSRHAATSSPEASASPPSVEPTAITNETEVARELREGYTHFLRLLATQQIHSFPYNSAEYRAREATKMLPARDQASVAELLTNLRTAAGICRTRSEAFRIPSRVVQYVEGGNCGYAMNSVWFEDLAQPARYEWKSDDQTVIGLAGVTRIKSTLAQRVFRNEAHGYLRTETGEFTFADGQTSNFYFESASYYRDSELHQTVNLVLYVAGTEVEIRLGYDEGPSVNGVAADRVVPLW